MVSFRSKQAKSVAEIHLSPNVDHTSTSQPNVWLSNEDIKGSAIFRLPPGVDFSHSKITLRGLVTTQTDDCPGSLQRSWRTEKLPFFGVTLDSTARSEFKSDDGVVKVPFRFNLDEIHSQNRSPTVTDLPPSLSSRDDGAGWTSLRKNEAEGQFDVYYVMTASVFSKKGLQASTTKTIPILPVSQAQPPLSPSDFPGEYFFAASTPQQSKFSLGRAPSFGMEVAGEEPEAIVLDPHSFSSGSTNIHFVVKALPRPSTPFEANSLPSQCQLRARLVTKTLITPDRIEEKAIPTIEQAKYGQNSSLSVHKSDEQEFTVALPHWDHIAPDSAEQFALSNFSFMFNITRDKAPIPTFFTPLLSRRYALEIAMTFLGVSSPSLKLSLPLQIVYEVDEFDCIKPT